MSALNPQDVQFSGTTLTISSAAMALLRAHVENGYPFEVVGILAGARSTGRVSDVVALANERIDDAANRYAVSALALMKAERQVAKRDLDVLGYYHSHPDHPAMFSDTDRDLALPNMSYLIAAVHEGTMVDVMSWRLREDRTTMDRETLLAE
ncbi:MAG: M67 family metallopeptidase [Myxococcota bacterium]